MATDLDYAQGRVESLAYQVGYALAMLRGIVRELDSGRTETARRYAVDAIAKLEA